MLAVLLAINIGQFCLQKLSPAFLASPTHWCFCFSLFGRMLRVLNLALAISFSCLLIFSFPYQNRKHNFGLESHGIYHTHSQLLALLPTLIFCPCLLK